MTETTGASGETVEGSSVDAPDVGLPARLDMRRALDIYVSGRNRTLDPTEKGILVGGPVETPYATPAAGSAESPAAPRGPGVSVPSKLSFDRNAGTWRQNQGS